MKLSKLSANISKLYVYWFFHSLILAYVIERLFWQARGMTVDKVIYCEIIYAAVVMLLEVPTGVVADRWSRKNMLVIGALFSCAEFAILIFAARFWHFAAAVSAGAVQKAFTSGSANALLYDSLQAAGEERHFEKVLGRLRLVRYGASLLAALLGSLAAVKIGLLSTYYVSLGSLLISLLVSLTLTEAPLLSDDRTGDEKRGDLSAALAVLKDRPQLLAVLSTNILMAVSLTYVDEFWQLYVDMLGIPIALFGVILAVNSVSASWAGVKAHLLVGRFNISRAAWLVPAAAGCFLLLLSAVNTPAAVVMLVPLYVLGGGMEPLAMGYLHHSIGSRQRATVESLQSLVQRLAMMLVGLLFGWVSQQWTVLAGFRLLAALNAFYLLYVTVKRGSSVRASNC